MVKTKLETNNDGKEVKKSRPSSQILGISRSISACQRCRVKKVRCDQNFPKCLKCEKAGVECIGLDPATGREVPRSYVIHLEDRIAVLEGKLKENGIDPDTVRETTNSLPLTSSTSMESSTSMSLNTPINGNSLSGISEADNEGDSEKEQTELLNEVKFNSINSKNNRSISTGQSISFGKLMSTAVKFQSKKSNMTTPEIGATPNHIKEDIPLALLPPKKTAQQFLRIFFAQTNAQLPILHREEFLKNCFLPIYGKLDANVSLASNYTAINHSIFQNDDYYNNEQLTWFYQYKVKFNESLTTLKANNQPIDAIKISNGITPPKKFHKALYFLNIIFAIASSVHHLQYPMTISDSFKLSAIKYVDQVYASSDQLESLQGILLLALYSIMRPAVPGCWYVVGSALRLCIDLGLHNESINERSSFDSFTIDKRRRLFWCTYSLDRQICFYLSRPVGIPDESITTPFPSELDDALIIPNDNNQDYSKNNSGMSSYKSISISFFKMRKIQSEVQKHLFESYELPRRFTNLQDWKNAISKHLKSWKNSGPKTKRKMNCDFNLDFFHLNYHHTVLVLHGLSPKNYKLSIEDFFQVSESSKELINIYTSLLSSKSINYTWAAILNLFMAGTSYLYTIYNSEQVRQVNGLFEVKKITQECINVMNSLIDRCDAAANCKNTFETLSAAVVKLKYNETVQGNIRMPSSNQINKLPPGQLSNLHHLVDNLNDNIKNGEQSAINPDRLDDSERISIKIEKDLNPFSAPSGSLDNLDMDKLDPATFEWTNKNDEFYQGELDHFFNELEKSPSNQSRRNSFSETDFINYEQNVWINSGIINTPYSYDSNDSTTSSPVINMNMNMNMKERSEPSKDGRKVYELIHQVPVDSIWDQFFTTHSNFET
ncbi:pyrimidine pathway regulatory protein 1 [[Candida] jaroonii]|uniref:Pyrimidine pathway regulatory protein 1 n=1 Tax=[Candida] jaroonii TaxID=467808 RepID=A0ACA9Y187_9ASCO|nr:pyrimidine pathway regulatory protein 1 [[Candida] jaroonii]